MEMAAIPKPDNTIKPSAIGSEELVMPNIPALVSEVERLQGLTDWWANGALWLTAATALAALLYFGASRMTIWRGAQLRAAQSALNSAKEDQSAREALQARDRYIELKTASDKVGTDLERQKERTAKAEKDLLELRIKMADRVLRPEQKNRMLAVLKTRPPGSIVIQSVLRDGNEAFQFAVDIAGVFREAGWTVTDPSGLGSFTSPIAGVFIVATPDMNSNGMADFIANALIAGGVTGSPVQTSVTSRNGNGVLEVWVAAKPK